MISRTRILTTLSLLCHLVLMAALLTTELQAQGDTRPATTRKTNSSRGNAGEPITFSADEQEKRGDIYELRGNVEILFRKYKLQADEVEYNDATGVITATGHIVFDGGQHDEHMTATRATYNVDTESGRFWDAAGTTGARSHGKTVVLTTSNPFFFRGSLVDKLGDKYVVHHGIVTSCKLPRPKWSFRSSRVTVVPGDDAKLLSSSFWVWRLPVFYFPFFDHSVERRTPKTGFLMPMVGLSSTKGTIVSDGFFLSLTRSMNATLGAQYFSRRGWAQHADFRAWLNEHSYLVARYYGVLDRGDPKTGQDQGGEELRVTGETHLHDNIRGVLDVNYLSSYLFRIVFGQSFAEPMNSEVHSTGFLTDNWNGYSLNAVVSRYQNFQSPDPGNVITISHAPSFEFSSADRQLGNSPLYWGFDSSVGLLSRDEPDFTAGANVSGRVDIFPHLSMPLFWHGWSLRPDLAARDTWYTARVASGGVFGQSSGVAVNRHALDTDVEIRPPALERTFDNEALARRFKHTIEPLVVYHNTTGIDNFSEILRFDARDVMSDTNEVEYGILQRLYSKPVPRKNCPAVASPATAANPKEATEKSADTSKQTAATDRRETHPTPPPQNKCVTGNATELVSWEVAQKYFFDPFFGGALVPGVRNVFTTTVDFTGIAFLTQPRQFSPIISRLRLQKADFGAEWNLDYDTKLGNISSSQLAVRYRFPHDLSVLGSHTFLHVPGEVVPTTAPSEPPPPSLFNQFGLNVYYGHPNRRGFSFTSGIGYDARQNFVQTSGVRASYNWDCCGITFEYGRNAISPVIQRENVFRFAFSLANVGTFGTLPRALRTF